MTLLTMLQLAAGLILLVVGAEALVRGASRLAALMGISPLVIGLTVVAIGTSSPELAVSIQAALSGQAEIAVGNVLGSNIFNVLLILGLSALIVPLTVSSQLIRWDVHVMIGVSLVVWGMAADRMLARWEGLVLLAGIAVYLVLLYRLSRGTAAEGDAPAGELPDSGRRTWLINPVLVAVGLALLVLGSRWLVAGAVAVARWFDLSELIIGLTIVAAGTSLPEVVTSIVASLKGERDIAVGNVVGSNIFNLLAVLGGAVAIAPGGIAVSDAAVGFDFPVMAGVALVCLPIFFTGMRISRPEGLLFLGYYLAYLVYLFLAAGHHDALTGFTRAMAFVVVPLTLVGLAAGLWRGRRAA